MPGAATEQLSDNEVASVCRNVMEQTKQWTGRQTQNTLVNPAAAVSALGELSPGGALMRGFQQQSLAGNINNCNFDIFLFPLALIRIFFVSQQN